MSENDLNVVNNPSSELEAEIPPWALPKEEITFYMKLDKNVDFSKIVIDIPDCMEVKGFINVVEHAQQNNIVEIFEIGRYSSSKKDYCGITIASIEHFKELAVKSKITIKLHKTNGSILETETHARIFRPSLEIEQIPENISLNDVEETTLPIHLKFKGFGDTSMRIEANIGGDLVSEGGGSIMDRLFHGLLLEGFFNDNLEEKDEKSFTINKIALTQALDDLKTKLKDAEYVKELENDKKITKESINWLKSFNTSEQEKFMTVLYDTMEGFLIKKLTDMFSRNLSRHLQIDSGTTISTKIKAELTNLNLTIYYKDLLGNSYPSLTATVKIIDKRKTDPELRVVIPIEVKNVDETEAYKDVSAMVIQNVD